MCSCSSSHPNLKTNPSFSPSSPSPLLLPYFSMCVREKGWLEGKENEWSGKRESEGESKGEEGDGLGITSTQKMDHVEVWLERGKKGEIAVILYVYFY